MAKKKNKKDKIDLSPSNKVNGQAIKCSRAEYLRRIEEVQHMLVNMYPTHDIVQSMTKKYNIGWRMTYRYINSVYKRWARQQEKNIDKKYLNHINARKEMAKVETDGRLKLAIMRDIGELEGLYTQKIDVGVKKSDPILEMLECIRNSSNEGKSETRTDNTDVSDKDAT